MSAHTPGPWRWKGGTLLGPDDRNASFDDCLLRCVIGGEPERKADEHLIAAAPDLFAAAEALLAADLAVQNSQPLTAPQWDEVIDALAAAVKKARGET